MKRILIAIISVLKLSNAYSQTFIGYPLIGTSKYYYSSTNNSLSREQPLYVICEDGSFERIAQFKALKLSEKSFEELKLPRDPIKKPDSVVAIGNIVKENCYYPIILQFHREVKITIYRSLMEEDSAFINKSLKQNYTNYEIGGMFYCFEDKYKNQYALYDIKLRNRAHDFMIRYFVTTENGRQKLSFRLY